MSSWDKTAEYLARHWSSFAGPVGVLIATILAGVIARRVIFRLLDRWTRHTGAHFDNALVNALRAPFLLWTLMLGLHLATQVSRLPDKVTHLTGKGLLILWVLSLTIVASRIAAGLVAKIGSKAHGALPVTSLSQNLARMVVASFGALILLNQLGLDITPMLTALGVGGLAVALALQDTLTNLFAGFYVSLAGQVRVRDYIKLNTGEEGFVADIGWRSTTIRALPNSLIIVPNSKLSQAIVTNFSLPDGRLAISVSVSVPCDLDPDEIERMLFEEASAAAKEVHGLLPEPAPSVSFSPGFGTTSLDFTVGCYVEQYTDQFQVQHELRKRILRRFRREGIPFPPAVPATMGNGSGARHPEEAPVEHG